MVSDAFEPTDLPEPTDGAPSPPATVDQAVVLEAGPEGEPLETVEHPAKVMRIASMIKQLLEEVRQAPLDEPGRARLREIYKTSVEELATSMSPDLQDELERVTLPFAEGETPTEPELRIAQAQLVGWLDGLFHGIQATVFAQQMAARAQLEERRGLPPAADRRMSNLRPPGYL